MKPIRQFVVTALVTGLLTALPVYLAVLLILKGMKTVGSLLRPLVIWHPQGWPTAAEDGLALLVIVIGCFILGIAVLVQPGRAIRDWTERVILHKIPGYLLVRSLTQQIAGQGRESTWKPAVVQFDDGQVVAFIIEEIGDGRYTVFVPNAPQPFSGSIYIVAKERVRPSNVSFAETVQALSRWGSGAGKLVAALDSELHDRHDREADSKLMKHRAS